MQSGAVLARYAYQSAGERNVTAHLRQVAALHGCEGDSVGGISDCMRQLHWRKIVLERHRVSVRS